MHFNYLNLQQNEILSGFTVHEVISVNHGSRIILKHILGTRESSGVICVLNIKILVIS